MSGGGGGWMERSEEKGSGVLYFPLGRDFILKGKKREKRSEKREHFFHFSFFYEMFTLMFFFFFCLRKEFQNIERNNLNQL